MTWKVEWDDRASKELRKLDNQLQSDILDYLHDRIATDNDPRRFGKPFSYDKYGLWRYRVRDARIICCIEDEQVTVLVTRAGHRKDVYE